MAGAEDSTSVKHLGQEDREGNMESGGGDVDVSKAVVGGGKEDEIKGSESLLLLPQCRIRAKVVAYIDMIIMALYLGFCVAFFTQVTVHLVTINEKYCLKSWGPEAEPSYVKAILGSLWILLLAGILGRGVAMWTSIKLLQATLFAASRQEAEKLTWYWRAFTVAGFFVSPVVMAIFGVALYLIPMSTFFLCFLLSSMTLLAYDMMWRYGSYRVVSTFLKSFRGASAVNSGGIQII